MPPLLVLVVEDEFLIALDAQRMILDWGASEVLLANSLAEAERLLGEHHDIALVVLDLQLGRAHAGALAVALVNSGKPLVITSGFAGDGAELGVPLLTKPYEENALRQAIEGALAART